MAGGLLHYSGLVTKTRAMQGRLLSREVLGELAEYERVEDFIGFLKEAGGYASVYAGHEEVSHRGQVETFIHNSLYADYMRLYQFADRSQREGLDLIFFRYEVNVLKRSFANAFQKGGSSDPVAFPVFFDRHSGYDTAAVMRAKTLPELRMALLGTRYERLFEELSAKAGENYGVWAAGLDVYYYQRAWKQKDTLADRGMRQIFTRILGTEIDWMNIFWMYRAKKFFGMKPVDIYAESIPVFYKLKPVEYRRLLETESIEEFLALLGQCAYFKEKEAVVKLGDEITFRRIMERTYAGLCRSKPMSIAPVLCYLYEKENEIDALTTILEGIRYQVSPKDIRDLVLVAE